MFDINKMYRQIVVSEEQRRFQRILWRLNTHLLLSTFAANTYGTNLSSFLTTRCLRQIWLDCASSDFV